MPVETMTGECYIGQNHAGTMVTVALYHSTTVENARVAELTPTAARRAAAQLVLQARVVEETEKRRATE